MGERFREPGLDFRGAFYQARVLGGITTAKMVAFAYILNALVYALPIRMWTKLRVGRVGLDVFVGLLDIFLAVVYAVIAIFLWLRNLGASGFLSLIREIFSFPWLLTPTFHLLLLSIVLLEELYEQFHFR